MPIGVAAFAAVFPRPPMGELWHRKRDGAYQDSVSFLSENRQ